MTALCAYENELQTALDDRARTLDAAVRDKITHIYDRATKTFMRDLVAIDPAKLVNLEAGLDDQELLAYLIVQAIDNQPIPSREAKIKLKGKMAFRALLSQHGGVLSRQQVSDFLGITEEAVRKRRDRRKLLGVKQGDHYVYPLFQFNDDGEVIKHFAELMQRLPTDDEISIVRFFLMDNARLEGSVIDALQNGEDIDQLEALAERYMEHGAT